MSIGALIAGIVMLGFILVGRVQIGESGGLWRFCLDHEGSVAGVDMSDAPPSGSFRVFPYQIHCTYNGALGPRDFDIGTLPLYGGLILVLLAVTTLIAVRALASRRSDRNGQLMR